MSWREEKSTKKRTVHPIAFLAHLLARNIVCTLTLLIELAKLVEGTWEASISIHVDFIKFLNDG